MSSALAVVEKGGSMPSPLGAQPNGFDFSDLRIFTSIPRYHHDVAAMHGLVVVYDTDCIGREGIQLGKLYVREHQQPFSNMSWEGWLQREWDERHRRAGPSARLRTSREVVQAIHWPYEGDLALRMATGGVDGPYYEWAYGSDLIGKVVGVYSPEGIKAPPNGRA